MNNKRVCNVMNGLIFLLGMSNHVFAGNIIQNGLYFGGDIGTANSMTKESHSVNPESHQLGSIGEVAGLYLGYDYQLANCLGVALEGFADVTNNNTYLKHSANKYNMDQKYQYGLRLLPKYALTHCTALHVIIGYTNAKFHIHDNGVYGYIGKHYHQNGFQTGIGFTTAAMCNFYLRLDALYNTYPSKTNRGVGLTTPTQHYTNRFSQLAGEIAVIYKFC